jgi:CheY-like chemotaxis protein
VLLGVRHRGGNARIVVADTGPGIPEDRRLDIFREFSQGSVPTPGRVPGTGLGLAIVQRLALLLHHRLDVRSVPGKGSAFSVEVPLAEEWVPAIEGEQAEADQREVAGATVVVVDDDREIQEGLGMLLEEWGCHPVIASSADEAVELVRAGRLRPDVVLADLHLGGGECGRTTISAIRAHAGHAVPAFLFTGDTAAATEMATSDGFLVLRKPVDPLRLRSVLADALGR